MHYIVNGQKHKPKIYTSHKWDNKKKCNLTSTVTKLFQKLKKNPKITTCIDKLTKKSM